jgi:uncharacterized protein YlxW (UPF0749 family)
MEKLLESTGLAGMIAAIVVMLALNLVINIAKSILKARASKDSTLDGAVLKLTDAVLACTHVTERLEQRIIHLEQSIRDVEKLKLDIRRAFKAVRLLSGDKWEIVRKKIMEEEVPS